MLSENMVKTWLSENIAEYVLSYFNLDIKFGEVNSGQRKSPVHLVYFH